MKIASIPQQNRHIQIVGIGASAGGLESFTQLLNQFPNDTGLSLIFVQHLDPTHPSLATEILSRATSMPVTEIKDEEPVQANHVYTLPPNCDLTMKNGILKLQSRENASPVHKTIDTFFHSLAADKGMLAIGVVLSGTATDGVEGLRAIKAAGGITFAQSPKSAKFDGMPKAAIDSGAVDFTLPPYGIAEELMRIAKHPYIVQADQSALPRAEQNDQEVSKISEDPLTEIILLLKQKMNLDFSEYKKTTLRRRIARRMIILKLSTEKEYASFLNNHPDEVATLCSEILIHVTGFFRDPESFTVLKRKVFPQIVKNHANGTPIRIWVPGCSSGEEAYSLAISLLDELDECTSELPIQIFASDISSEAIKTARQGVYSAASVKSLSTSFLQRFFTKTSDGYKVNKTVRDICLFSKHDLISDPPFARVDLISCRNVLIYFTPVLQKRAIPLFHYALNPGGFLFLGHSETIGNFSNLFHAIDKIHKIYEKKPNVNLPRIQFSSGIYAAEKSKEKIDTSGKKTAILPLDYDSQKEADRIVALKYGPSAVVISDDLEILQFRGRTVPYLEQPSGNASHRLLKMAHPDLVADLRTLFRSVKSQMLPMKREGIRFEHDGKIETLNIEMVPLNPSVTPKDRQYLVLFEKSIGTSQVPLQNLARNSKSKKTLLHSNLAEQTIQQLEQQLAASKEYQQALSEDHESAQEEITVANEELQSTNEELQSTNEELETAKEELQSTNEELVTVNDELQNRNTELGQLNNDLINLLGSIEIPILIVDGDHRIRRFTPSTLGLFNLIPTDVGRPIQDIRSHLNISDLDSLISEVMNTLKIKEIEVQDHNAHWYRLQVRPYRTMDHRIDGVVLTFVDIEALKLAIGLLKRALDYATSVADALHIPSIVMDRNLRVKSVNQLFCKIFDVSPTSAEGRLLTDLGSKNWDISQLKASLENTILQEKPFQDFEVSSDFPSIGQRTFLLSARQIQWADLPEPESILLSLMDITERKKIELALEESEEKYRALLESAHDAIVATDDRGFIQVINRQAENWFGYTRDELIGKTLETLVPEALRDAHIKLREDYTLRPTARPMGESSNLSGLRKDGSTFPIEVSLSPIKTSRGLLVSALIRDVTWRRQYEQERSQILIREQESRSEAERANLAKDVFLATLSHELRTPLSSILTWAQLIRSGKVDFEKAKQGASVIEQSAKTQSQLIDDLLDISRIISGKLALKIQEVDPRPVISLAMESVRAMTEKKSIQIVTVFNKEVGIIHADPIRLQQIIWNLLTNAIKFSPKNHKIEIHLDLTKNQTRRFVEIKVIDHGKGIPPKFLPQIFNRFTQADSTSTRLHGGLGLGLSIVRNLVELQGGNVHAENAHEGTGAIFTVTFPMVSEMAAIIPTESTLESHSEGDSEEQLSLDGLRILVVDDDASTCESITLFLKAFGAEVAATESVREAMKMLPSFKPHVLVSDIAMPDEDGYSLIKKMRELSPSEGGNIPALALTAYATAEDSERALAAGFQAHVAKPVEANELAKIIRRIFNMNNSMFDF